MHIKVKMSLLYVGLLPCFWMQPSHLRGKITNMSGFDECFLLIILLINSDIQYSMAVVKSVSCYTVQSDLNPKITTLTFICTGKSLFRVLKRALVCGHGQVCNTEWAGWVYGPYCVVQYHSPRAAGTAVRGWGTCRCSSRPVRTDRRSRPAGRRWQDSKERPRCSTLAGHTPPLAPGTWYLPALAGSGKRGRREHKTSEITQRSQRDEPFPVDLFVKNLILIDVCV